MFLLCFSISHPTCYCIFYIAFYSVIKAGKMHTVGKLSLQSGPSNLRSIPKNTHASYKPIRSRYPLKVRALLEKPKQTDSEIRNEAPVKLREFGYKKDIGSVYDFGHQLGAGAFAAVRLATHKETGEKFAVKSMFKKFRGGSLDPLFANRVQHEVDILNHLGRSLSVAYLYDVYEDDKTVDLVLELCEGGHLWGRIKKGRYSETTACNIIREVLRAVAQCHAAGVVVRDVKPENFLLASSDPDDFTLKLIDFGISQYCGPEDRLNDRAGTPVFLAPEVVRQNYSQKSDVWSAGILAYLLLTGRIPFWPMEDEDDEGMTQEEDEMYRTQQKFDTKLLFRRILYSELDFRRPPWSDGQLSDDARDLVTRLLWREEAGRPTAEEALRHPWFSRLDDTQGGDAEGGAARGAAEAAEAAPLSSSLVQRVQRFGTLGRLRQLALKAMAADLASGCSVEACPVDDNDLSGLREAFRAADTDGDGKLSYDEFSAIVRSSFVLSEAEARQLSLALDVDHEGHVTWEEWVAALVDWRSIEGSAEWNQWAHRAFELFDKSHTGTIDRCDLAALFHPASPDDIEAALREADMDRDGSLSFDEFEHLLRATLPSLDLFQSRRRHGGEGGVGRAQQKEDAENN